MEKFQKFSLFFLRLSLGWMFFYAGIIKIINPEWSAAGYLKGAKSLIWFYQWLLTPNILPIINFANEWGLTLLGISLILGIAVRLSAIFGALLMLLYYLVILDFPYPNPEGFCKWLKKNIGEPSEDLKVIIFGLTMEVCVFEVVKELYFRGYKTMVLYEATDPMNERLDLKDIIATRSQLSMYTKVIFFNDLIKIMSV